MSYLKILLFFQNYVEILKYLVKLYVIGCERTKVIYRSHNFLILDKGYDIKINSNNKKEETIQTFVKRVLPCLSSKKLYHEFHFVHRLDYSTSGLMCIPLHKKACQVVSKVLQDCKCEKYYLALLRGHVSKHLLDLKFSIGRDYSVQEIEKMCVSTEKKARTARTLIVTLEKGLFDNYPATKVLIRPITGRRHQIRVHCSHIGHTVVGDYTYSNRKDTKPHRMYLHALRLVIPNEIENISIETNDPFNNKERSWKPFFTHLTFEEAFKKIEECLLHP